MAKKEINNEIEPEVVDAEAAADMADESTPGTAVATRGSNDVALGGVGGDVSLDEMDLPRLQIAYGVGGLATEFNSGDLVLGGEHRLAGKGDPLQVIVLKAFRYWKEWLSGDQFEAGLTPRNAITREEVIEMGGTYDWNQKDKDGVFQKRPTFSCAMDLQMLIRKPGDLMCGVFGDILDDGNEYAPAIWTVDKQAYKKVGPVVLQAQGFSLRDKGLLAGVFEVKTEIKQKGARTSTLPVFKLTGYNDEEMIRKISNLFRKPQA